MHRLGSGHSESKERPWTGRERRRTDCGVRVRTVERPAMVTVDEAAAARISWLESQYQRQG